MYNSVYLFYIFVIHFQHLIKQFLGFIGKNNDPYNFPIVAVCLSMGKTQPKTINPIYFKLCIYILSIVLHINKI